MGYAGYPYAGYSYGYPYAYGAYGYYGKRSADAEPKADADASPLWSLWICWIPICWILLWIPICLWCLWILWKRSADAEPKADAGLYYGGYYGYARPYAYGY